MKTSNNPQFNRYYELHCKHLRLKGLQPKTIDAYSRALRRIGDCFDFQVDNLSQDQLLDYFHALLKRLSWSAVKLDLYGLKFFYTHVLKKTWSDISLIKSPRTKRIPDIISVDETQKLIMATDKLSYRVFFFTLYSMGLRLGEGLRLQIGDINATPIVSTSAMPKATRIALCRCLTIPYGYYVVSGHCIDILSSSFPVVNGD